MTLLLDDRGQINFRNFATRFSRLDMGARILGMF